MNETRKKQLRRLISEKFSGKQSLLSDRTGISPAQIGQWLSDYRVMNEKSARKIERLCGLADGWMDGADDIKSSEQKSGEWPFLDIQESEWRSLSDRAKGLIEGYVKKMIEDNQRDAAKIAGSQKEIPHKIAA